MVTLATSKKKKKKRNSCLVLLRSHHPWPSLICVSAQESCISFYSRVLLDTSKKAY